MEQVAQKISDISAQIAALQSISPEVFMGCMIVVCFALGWIAGRLR